MDSSGDLFRDLIIGTQKYLCPLGVWPDSKNRWISIVNTTILCGYALMVLIKNLLQPERESIENAFTLANGSLVSVSYFLPMVLKTNKFKKFFEFMDKNRKIFVNAEHKRLILAGEREYRLITSAFIYILFPSVLVKFVQPPIEYVYVELFDPERIYSLPPSMGFPVFLFGELPTYVMESLIRTIMLTILMAVNTIFILSCLYIITLCNILSMEMQKFEKNSHKVINRLIENHQELLEYAKLLNEMYSPYFFVDCALSFINLSILMFSLIVSNASIQNYITEIPLMTAGMSQLFFLMYFGDRLIDAVSHRTILNSSLLFFLCQTN